MPSKAKAIPQASEKQTMNAPDFILRNRLIDRKELRQLVPYSDSQIYRLERAGRFPSRITLGPGRVAWRLSEVLDWIDAKQEGRVWKSNGPSGEVTHA